MTLVSFVFGYANLTELTLYGTVASNGHLFRKWVDAWGNEIITWTNDQLTDISASLDINELNFFACYGVL